MEFSRPRRDMADRSRQRRRIPPVVILASIVTAVSVITPLPASASTPPDSGPTTARADRVTCEEAPDVFRPLCTAYEVITRNHVDVVEDRRLAEAAAERVRGAGLAERTTGEPPTCPLPAPEFEGVCEVIDGVQDTAAAVEEAIRGMAIGLGTNSYYLTAEQYRRFRVNLENRGTIGVGLAIALAERGEPCLTVSDTCRPVISEVYEGTPAERAGLQAGDVLVQLGDRIPAGLGCMEVSRLDRFETGETVAVVVQRAGETFAMTITAASLAIPVARSRVVDGDIGHLRLDVFSSSADDEVAKALDGLTDRTLSGLVLDLRDNGGGYVNSAVGTAGIFLPDLSVIVHLVGREKVETVSARGKEMAPDPSLLPMVVLVNGGSASATEMVVSALQDQGRATVVGQTTFGKDTGQSSYQLEQGGTLVGVLHLTTLRWLSPYQRSASGGFEPDVVMDLPSCLLPAEVARRAISAIRPRIAELAITSEPENGDPYTGGDRVTVAVTFTSPVVVNRNGGNPVLVLDVGGYSRGALYRSGSGTAELVFEYTVADEDADADGISIAADSLSTGRANVGLPSGLDAVLTHDAIGPDPRHQVAKTSDGDSGGFSFVDIQGNAHEPSIVRIAAARITLGCNPPAGTRYCPDEEVTRAQMATFLARALDLPEAAGDYFTDDAGSAHEDSINRVAEAGITLGCAADSDRYCPDQPVTRAQMATFLARALDLPEAAGDYFTDDAGSAHEDSINRVAEAGITLGCGATDSDRYCPDQVVTRAQMATFLARALQLPEGST